MSSLHNNDALRRSSASRHDDENMSAALTESTAQLDLIRTRSQEPAVVESIAVQEVPQESKRGATDTEDESAKQWPTKTRYLVLLCAFFTSLSFGVTQVPLLYVFRLMTCDAYYASHPDATPSPQGGLFSGISAISRPPAGGIFSVPAHFDSDRCSIRPIEASTALSISLVGASTTVCGLVNLFLTGALIKRIGVKPTLVLQTFFPALRLLVQNIGVEVWGYNGIAIVQASQLISIIGGPSGYLLVLNTFITEVVEYEGRTAALGRLTGSMMFGSATGFLLGGIVADAFGIRAPFRLTLLLFLGSCAYVVVFLPHIPPAEGSGEGTGKDAKKKPGLLKQFFGPLTVFAPRKFILQDGVVTREYGAFLLAWGVFLGILATGYLPTLLQLYATDVFAFGTKENGWLIFMYSMLRGVFLTFAFPKLIAVGRQWTLNRKAESDHAEDLDNERRPLLAQPGMSAITGGPKNAQAQQTFTFDLTYTRFSLIADGLLTLLCSFVHKGWQMYLVAAVLPFAAGTGSAAKGTVLQMVGSSATSSERTDALAGVSLVENMARLTTTFVFGAAFAAFTSIGRTELLFTCNAAVAILGFIVLLFARFPPEGSRRIEKENQT